MRIYKNEKDEHENWTSLSTGRKNPNFKFSAALSGAVKKGKPLSCNLLVAHQQLMK